MISSESLSVVGLVSSFFAQDAISSAKIRTSHVLNVLMKVLASEFYSISFEWTQSLYKKGTALSNFLIRYA